MPVTVLETSHTLSYLILKTLSYLILKPVRYVIITSLQVKTCSKVISNCVRAEQRAERRHPDTIALYGFPLYKPLLSQQWHLVFRNSVVKNNKFGLHRDTSENPDSETHYLGQVT